MVQPLRPGGGEASYDSTAMRRFVGIDLGREAAPDETTILRFRHLLEKHHLGKKLFEQMHRHLEAQGLTVARGTMTTGPSAKRRVLKKPLTTIFIIGSTRMKETRAHPPLMDLNTPAENNAADRVWSAAQRT